MPSQLEQLAMLFLEGETDPEVRKIIGAAVLKDLDIDTNRQLNHGRIATEKMHTHLNHVLGEGHSLLQDAHAVVDKTAIKCDETVRKEAEASRRRIQEEIAK